MPVDNGERAADAKRASGGGVEETVVRHWLLTPTTVAVARPTDAKLHVLSRVHDGLSSTTGHTPTAGAVSDVVVKGRRVLRRGSAHGATPALDGLVRLLRRVGVCCRARVRYLFSTRSLGKKRIENRAAKSAGQNGNGGEPSRARAL